jgi:hypothetical protein
MKFFHLPLTYTGAAYIFQATEYKKKELPVREDRFRESSEKD